MYKVLSVFADLQDFNHSYNVGDEYPRKGYSPSEARVEELSTDKNLLHKPLIQLVETEPVVKEVVEEVVEEVTEKPTRGRRKKDDRNDD